MNYIRLKIIIILSLFTSYNCFSQNNFINELRKNIIVLGYVDNEGRVTYVGTGFLVEIDSIFHLVTAKHVVTSLGTRGELTNNFNNLNLYAFYNTKSGQIKRKSIYNIIQSYNVDWLVHENILVDIALLPFDIIPEDDLKVIPQIQFLNTHRLFETYEVYLISYHPGLVNVNDFKPIFRTGTISRVNKDNTILIDAFVFPGNSGSPVFLKTSPIRFDRNAYVIGTGADELGNKFIGIIGSYYPYEDIAISSQTNKPRVIFQENSGIARVWSVNFLQDIINNPNSIEQINRVKSYIRRE